MRNASSLPQVSRRFLTGSGKSLHRSKHVLIVDMRVKGSAAYILLENVHGLHVLSANTQLPGIAAAALILLYLQDL